MSASGRVGGLARVFFLDFWIFFVKRCLIKLSYMHIWARSAFWGTLIFGYSKKRISQKFSALAHDRDL